MSKSIKTNQIISNRREKIGWYFTDFASSAFSTTVVTVFLGPYLTGIAENASDASGYIHLLGIPILADSWFAYCVSFSVIMQVLFLPIIGALADYLGKKKGLLLTFSYIGAIATSSLYFLDGDSLKGGSWLFGGIIFIIANLCFGVAMVLYNAFLNDIAEKDERDKESSRAWAFGYFGGGLLLALNLYLFSNAEDFGLSTGEAVRISLCSAGMWWGIFMIFPMIWLRKGSSKHHGIRNKGVIKIGFRELWKTVKDAKKYPLTLMFLLAYLIYNDGVQAVITFASQFGNKELGLPLSVLTTVILMVQVVALFGALAFAKIAQMTTTKTAILLSLLIWTIAMIYAWGYLEGEAGFYALGICVGFVMGGTQALSRSLFSRLIPPGKEAEYFSLYEVSERGTAWMGSLIFGLSLQFSGSYRIAVLSLIVFFIIGGLLLIFVNIQKAEEQVNLSK
jgi:MFS transporter, UMF1 family